MLSVMIVDDEPLARAELRELLAEQAQLHIVAECANAVEAISTINQHQPDIVFLDIQMPRISGLEMVSMLDKNRMPHIVFVTAFDDYALQAFEEQAFDYLLKPIDPARLQKTLQRLYQASAPQPLVLPEPTPPLRQIPCQGHQRIFFLHLEEVEFAHTDLSGVQVVAHQQSGYTPLSLKVLEEKTPLLRCHRQYLVNPEQICELQFTDAAQVDIVTRSGHKVPVSRRYLRAVKDYLNIP